MPSKTPMKKKNEGNQDFLKRCVSSLVEQGFNMRDAAKKCSAQFSEQSSFDPLNLMGAVNFLTVPVQMEEKNIEDDTRGFLIVAKTGDPVETYYGQKLIIQIDGIRFEEKIPVLRSHDRDRIVGSGQGFLDGEKMYVEGVFSQSTNDATEVQSLADEGFPWQASIGVWAEEISFLKDGVKEKINGIEIVGPAEIWRKSYVREVSFTAIGADERTAAISLFGDADYYKNQTTHKEKIMDIETLKNDYPDLVEQIRTEAQSNSTEHGINLERSRVLEILEANAPMEITLKAIKDGIEATKAYKDFYFAEKEQRKIALAEMEQQATETQGNQSTGDGTGNNDAKNFMDLVKELKKTDNIKSTTEAMKKAVRLYPDEHKQFLNQNAKVA